MPCDAFANSGYQALLPRSEAGAGSGCRVSRQGSGVRRLVRRLVASIIRVRSIKVVRNSAMVVVDEWARCA